MFTLNKILTIVILIFIIGLMLHIRCVDKKPFIITYFWLLLFLIAIISIITYFGYYYKSDNDHINRKRYIRNVMLAILAFSILMILISYFFIHKDN